MVPSVLLVRVGEGGLEVMVDPSSPFPPQGWQPVDEGAVWLLDPDVTLADLEDRFSRDPGWPPTPALITAGTTPGGPVLVNLEAAWSLAVEGDPEMVRGFMGQVLVELTSQPWAEESLEGLHATGDLGAQQLPRVRGHDDAMVLAELLDGVSEQIQQRTVGWSSVAGVSDSRV